MLLPNKTEAMAYLDNSGPQPDRYARVSISYDCHYQEYMIGPLPVENSTTRLTPLNYIYRGNGTQETLACITDPPGYGGLEEAGEPQDWNGRELAGDDKAPPLTILPDGPRHSFDPAENYVEWMDFSFFTTIGNNGLALYDIRFQDERIIYELALQEALAHYAGIQHDAAGTAYLDVSIGFEPSKLVPGYDCPSYATYSADLSFCLFEFPKDYPIQRHTSEPNYHVTKNIAFLARSVSTIGNYDYQLTYEFYLDGSIEIVARASGYIAWTAWTDEPLDPSYGFHIRPDYSGSMHDHVLNFKLDLDIHGTANSLFKTEFVPISESYPWSNGTIVNTMKVNRSFIENESAGKINWSPNAAATYSVVNKDHPNQYGEFPGYRLWPSRGASIHSTIKNSTLLGNAINWATHHLYVLRRKDTEPSSAYMHNTENTAQPLVDFNTFFDDEDLTQTDLVLYFNLGMHHMPDTSDMPTTVFTGAQSAMMLRPQNYLLNDASRSTRQQVDVNVTNTDEEGNDVPGSAEYYGQKVLPKEVSLGQKVFRPDLVAVIEAALEVDEDIDD